MTVCSELVALLLDYLEGRLSADTQANLDRHLAGCPTCVAHVRTYRSTISLLHSIREEDLPSDLRLTLRAFLDRHAVN